MRTTNGLPFPVVTDREVREHLRAEEAVAWMREAVLAAGQGRLLAPPRLSGPLGGGALVATAGSMLGQSYGYRIYDTLGLPASEQVVVVHDATTGAVRAIAVGSEIGLRRTAAIGGAAHDALAPGGALTVGVIGSGDQAQGQLWALRAVRDIAEVRLFSRTAARREAVAKTLDIAYPFPVQAVTSPQQAVDRADVVILATNSGTPVIRTDWLQDDVYLATLGPKQVGRAEYDEDLLRRARLVTTDSIAQLNGYDPPAVAAQSGVDVTPLSECITAPPRPEGLRVYLSVGLSGTEPYLLDQFARTLAGH